MSFSTRIKKLVLFSIIVKITDGPEISKIPGCNPPLKLLSRILQPKESISSSDIFIIDSYFFIAY